MQNKLKRSYLLTNDKDKDLSDTEMLLVSTVIYVFALRISLLTHIYVLSNNY